MVDGSIYYCWSCDAHRRAVATAELSVCCPKCGKKLTEELRVTPASAAPAVSSFILSLPIVAPAAQRPRRALSA